MQSQVPAQIARLRKVQWTMVALVRLLAAMYPAVFSQCGGVAKGSAAHVTPIGSFALTVNR